MEQSSINKHQSKKKPKRTKHQVSTHLMIQSKKKTQNTEEIQTNKKWPIFID